MDGEGVLSQIRDLQSVIDGFQLDCGTSEYDSEDMDCHLHENEGADSPMIVRGADDDMEANNEQQGGSAQSEGLIMESREDIDQADEIVPEALPSKVLLNQILPSTKHPRKSLTSEAEPSQVLTGEEESDEAPSDGGRSSEDTSSEVPSSKAVSESILQNITNNNISRDPFNAPLEFRISTDFSALLDEFASKEYPISPVSVRPTYFQQDIDKKQGYRQNEMPDVQKELNENVNKRPAESIKGMVWRREISIDKANRGNTEQTTIKNDTTRQERNTRQNTRQNISHTLAARTAHKPAVSSGVGPTHKELQTPAVTKSSKEKVFRHNKRGDNDHQARPYEQMARIDDIEDRISLYDDYFQECIKAKTGLLEWTELVLSKGKPSPLTEGYEPPSRNADFSKSMLRSRSNLMVVTSSTSMNALRRSIMKIPKSEQPSRKPAGNTSASPNSDGWLDQLATPRIKERAMSFLSLRNLAPSRGFSTPNLRLISGPSQGLFGNKNRQISPMGAPTPMLRNNRVMNFKKGDNEAIFRQSVFPPSSH